MKTALLITTNDEFKEIEFENSLDFFYKNIGCDLIEIVPLRALEEVSDEFEKLIMVVDEEGLLKDEPKLNIYASVFYGSMIYGNVIIVNDGGDDFEGMTREDHDRLATGIAILLNQLERQYHE